MRKAKEASTDVAINATLTEREAWQYAQYLKRVGLSDYEPHAASQEEAYAMCDAGQKIREALRKQGYAPR